MGQGYEEDAVIDHVIEVANKKLCRKGNFRIAWDSRPEMLLGD